MKKLLHSIFAAIGSLFTSLESEVKTVILPAAVGVVNTIKTIVDFDQLDLLGTLVGNTALEDKLRSSLPIVLTELRLIDITISKDINEQLKTALEALKFSSDVAKAAFYHSIASMLVVDLSDGKLSWSEAVTLVEYYYHNEIEKNATN